MACIAHSKCDAWVTFAFGPVSSSPPIRSMDIPTHFHFVEDQHSLFQILWQFRLVPYLHSRYIYLATYTIPYHVDVIRKSNTNSHFWSIHYYHFQFACDYFGISVKPSSNTMYKTRFFTVAESVWLNGEASNVWTMCGQMLRSYSLKTEISSQLINRVSSQTNGHWGMAQFSITIGPGQFDWEITHPCIVDKLKIHDEINVNLKP